MIEPLGIVQTLLCQWHHLAIGLQQDRWTHFMRHCSHAQEGKRSCHWAAYFGTAQVLQELLEQRPNLEAKDRRGNTALHLAAAAHHL